MDEHDDKLLAAYDLTAWDAPPAPEGMVGRIISRARVPEAAAMKAPRRWKQAAVVVGTAAAALAAVLAFVVLGTERAPQNGGGLVRATKAQRLQLGSSFATLDAGTELHWQRRGTHVDVVQLEGGAVWNVAKSDTFVIETEDAGATVASVEATGASLRTEVQMLNRTDARVIGVGSAVAALVSITTVVVYEGRVKATSGGQVVNIQSGSTAQFPPSAPGNQQPDPQLNVGAGPTAPPSCDAVGTLVVGDQMHQDGKHIDALINYLQSYACKADKETAFHVAVEACHAKDESHAFEYFKLSEIGAHATIDAECKTVGIDLPSMLDDEDVKETCDSKTPRTKGEDFLNNGMDTAALSQFEIALKCKNDTPTKKMAYIASCRLKNQAKATEYFQQLGAQGSLVQVCMRFGIDPSAAVKKDADCDEVSCVLTNYEGACCTKFEKPVKKSETKKSETKKVEAKKDTACDEVSCVLNNNAGACCAKFKKTAKDTKCDAAESKSKGEDFMNNGMDTAALSQFETSLRCKPDTSVMKMAYISSCRLKNKTKATYYFSKLGSQGSLLQVCMRFGIDPAQ